VSGLVNSNQLEDEVAETSEVKNDDRDHAGLVLAAGEESGGEKNQNGDGNGDDGKGEFRIVLVGDDDNKLNDEAEEEEEIELEQSDVNLVVKESLLHAIISTDVLENIPSILLVDLPRKEAHDKSSKGNDGGDSHEVRLHIMPKLCCRHFRSEGVLFTENIKGLFNLIDLNGGVNHEGEVGEADTDDLNGVLLTKSIPNDNKCVKESENKERQESRNSLVLRLNFGVGVMITKVDLEFTKDVSRWRINNIVIKIRCQRWRTLRSRYKGWPAGERQP
jgi:hypothetical protein